MDDFCELGIDEAGRGPVLGPMVLAGVVIPKSKISLLKEWGITDSKSFGSSKSAKIKRAHLSTLITRHFDHRVLVIQPQTIDQYVISGSLNRLEQETASKIISRLKADTVILDGHNLFSPLENNIVKAYNKADLLYPCVSAASIVAKAERDRQFDLLCEPFTSTYGEIGGGGYANNKTLEFVKWYREKNGDLPPFYRRSYQWKAL